MACNLSKQLQRLIINKAGHHVKICEESPRLCPGDVLGLQSPPRPPFETPENGHGPLTGGHTDYQPPPGLYLRHEAPGHPLTSGGTGGDQELDVVVGLDPDLSVK